MIKSKYNVIGVMSGTSLDGIDLAYIKFENNSNWTFEIHASETIPYTDSWKQKLSNLVTYNLEDLKLIDKFYTIHLSHVIRDFIRKYQLSDIDAICSHGHTALHQPEQLFTYQIGNLPSISSLTNHLVVCDFRTQDVSLNGQGAPLVPIGDKLLFSAYDSCINLGGFANISSEINSERIAYDICPVNIVLNRYANLLGFDYDDGGKIAKSGILNQSLLQQLNSLDFYKQKAPKSLGVEWVDKHLFPLLETSQLSERDILRTMIEHIAIQISNVIKVHSEVLFTGGGVYNSFLLDRIRTLKEFNLVKPSNTIIEYKEALIFGLLGVLKLRGETNCLSSVTGADYDHSSGEIYNV
ncbi:anhydro-N-acetylmuramic acid kinase [uncultured Psychroserpens sp.]|uniref:anhydro-N-acetylmuramic acid kinase n=1 Tax=uncultured Psychroserpens sp. TaxID=255436 RepID=UPI002620C0B7|nr:anhydro-N-acetylmuramic acid kinase [uncultured Psychroserpens sp.]